MRIGYVTAGYPAGSETWIRLEVDGLREHGHVVEVWRTTDAVVPQVALADCEVLVCHFATLAPYAAAVGRPFVLVPHAADIFPDRGARLRYSIREYRNLIAVGCVSNYHTGLYCKWGVSREMLADWPIAVDTATFRDPERRLGSEVVWGGRDVPKKGFSLALEAWPTIRLFGCHPQACGWLAPADLARLYREAWCMLAPCIVAPNDDKDGLPIVVLEALAMGRRVVTTRISGLSDLSGYVTYADPNPMALRRAVEREPHDWNEAGAKYVRQRHDPKRVVANIEKLLEGRSV